MERLDPVPPDDLKSLETDLTYPTRFGEITFADLYARTSRTVGFVMRERLGMTNPEDIDDCMQSGYLKLWQRLEREPQWLADKPKRYIVQAIVLRSKAQRYAHQRHYRKLVYDADASQVNRAFAPAAHEIDTRLDLTQAIRQVALEIEDEPVALLSFYCLLTQATTKDVGEVFGYSPSTLYNDRARLRGKLVTALPGYGHGDSRTSRPVLASHVVAPVVDVQARRSRLREQIRPFTPAPEPTRYLTRWGGSMTMEAILSDPQVRRVAYAKVRQLGMAEADYDDCLQQGYLKLWHRLQREPGLLTDKGPGWVGIYVAFSGNPKQFHRWNQREQMFTDPEFDWGDADEYFRLGLLKGNRPTYARWTQEVDETLDVNWFMSTMLQHYADNPRKRIALQAITGLISAKEAAGQLGMHEKNFSASIGRQVRQEVQALLPDVWKETRSEAWSVKFARGEGLENVARVAQSVQDNQRLLLALYVVTTGVKRQDVATTFGMGLTCFARDIRTVKSMLAHAYHADSIVVT